MSISRWDPWGDIISLREAMSNLLEESFVRPRGALGAPAGVLGLAVDVLETPEAFVLTASVPGVKAEDVSITVLGNTVRLSGERREEIEEQRDGEGRRWLIRERHFGAFDRSVELPMAIKADDASAEFSDGVLKVTLPKADEAKPRTITVRSASSVAEIEVGQEEAGGASR
jgi:HSP20 family protein